MNTSSPNPSRGDARRWMVVLLVAFIGAAIAPTIFRQVRSRDLPSTRPLLVSMASTNVAVESLLTQPIWSETRGDGEGAVAPDARAVRLGAAIAELEVRRQRADSTVPSVTAGVVRLLETFPDSDGAVRAFQSLDGASNDSAIQMAAELAERAAGRRAVRLGGWLQSARFAAATSDTSLFNPTAITSVSQAAVTYDARPETEHAVRQFADIARERPRNWIALGTAVDELLRLLGTR